MSKKPKKDFVGCDIREWWPGFGWISPVVACEKLDSEFDNYFKKNKLRYKHLGVSQTTPKFKFAVVSHTKKRKPTPDFVVKQALREQTNFQEKIDHNA